VQRVTAQILEGTKEGVIEDIAIVGRPPHVFNGTMGDHSTAFITTAAGLQAQLKGKTIDEAASILHGLTEGLYNLPGMLLVMPQEHQERLDEALFELEDIWEFLELRMRSRASEGIPPYDQHDAAQIQRFAETFLEARELVPLSTINTKAINAPLAGKGKGESARLLVEANSCAQVPLDDLANAVVGLFDARSAAVVHSITEQPTMDRVAPGMRVAVPAGDRVLTMINQHLWSVDMMYPAAALQLRPRYDNIIMTLRQNIDQKIQENAQAQLGGADAPRQRGGNKNEADKRYLASSISLHPDGSIRDVRIEGRTTSPFSGTMGAHTTAWTVLIDRMRNQLESSTLTQAAEYLLEISEEAQKHLYEASSKFQADTKQLHKLLNALRALAGVEKKLKTIAAIGEDTEDTPIGPFQQLLTIQEAINCVLDLQNLTPGATLYVGNTNGAREGHYRGILLDYVKDKAGADRQVVRTAVLGLMDLKGLNEHRETIGATIESEMDEERNDAENAYYRDILGIGQQEEQEEQKDQDNKERFLALPTHDAKGVEMHLLNHHLAMVDQAYPGAVEYAAIDVTDENAGELIAEAATYSNEDRDEWNEDEEEA
jgi:hypothetical protein